jgi:hypothetical protein
MSCHQNAGQNHNTTANKSFENMAKFRYLGMTEIIAIILMKK